jgi:hypothetical protein
MKRAQFPVRIKRDSSVVTINRTAKQGYASFTVVHYNDAGLRCRRTFSEYTIARAAAKETAINLAGGKSVVLGLTGHDLLIYQRAKQALENLAVNLDAAAIQFAQALLD